MNVNSARDGELQRTESGEAAPGAPGARARRGPWRWLVAAGVVAVLAYFALSRVFAGHASSASAAKGAARAVPVVGATATVGDLGVYQNGLGTVTPVNTVAVRSRVDGELVSVAYREGQLVREGDLLAQIDPRPFEVQLHQAEGQLAKDEAALKNARVDLDRYRVLIKDNSVSGQQLDTQAATVDQTEAAIKSDRAQVESAKLNLIYSRITAPASGIVGLRLVDPGNIVHATDQNGLLVITQQQPITVIFTIAADHLESVLQQRKSGHVLPVEAWDRELKRKLATGSLLAIDNQIDPSTGTIRMRAQFANEDSALYPNQFVNVRLLVDTLHRTVLIPTAAIQRSPQSTYVYVVKPDSTVEMRTVDVQLTEGDTTSVQKGISSGEVVVVDGVDKLQPGTLVALAKSNGARQPNS